MGPDEVGDNTQGAEGDNTPNSEGSAAAAPVASGAEPAAGSGGSPAPAAGDKPGDPATPATGETPPADDKGGDQPADPAPVSEWKKDAIPADGLPDDWKDRTVRLFPEEQREKVKKVIDKYATYSDAMRGLAAADAKISELGEKAKGLIKVPGKDAKPEEIEAFRKALGVPETADKYDIKLDIAEGQEPSELDKYFINDVVKPELHKLGLTQEQVDGVAKLRVKEAEIVQTEAAKRAQQASERSQNHLRVEFGPKEYTPQVEVINRYVAEVVAKLAMDGPDGLKDGLATRFADGTCLGDKDWFVKLLAPIANQWADDNNIPRGEFTQGVDLEARKKEIMGKMNTDPKEYERLQPELDAIIAKLSRQQAKEQKAA